jgi:hypothetical protein
MPSIWTTPVTKANQDPTLFGDWNTYLRDNLLYLYDRAINNSGIPIASATVSGVSSYTFSSIPATYDHLLVRGWGLVTVSAATTMCLRLNGDTANNYDDAYYGYRWNVGAVSGGTAARSSIRITDDFSGLTTASVDAAGFLEAIIYDYQNPSTVKSVKTRAVGYAAFTDGGGQWVNASPAAVTSLTVLTNSGNNFSGELALYGFSG